MSTLQKVASKNSRAKLEDSSMKTIAPVDSGKASSFKESYRRNKKAARKLGLYTSGPSIEGAKRGGASTQNLRDFHESTAKKHYPSGKGTSVTTSPTSRNASMIRRGTMTAQDKAVLSQRRIEGASPVKKAKKMLSGLAGTAKSILTKFKK